MFRIAYTMLSWLSRAPFGLPVVPDVYIIVAHLFGAIILIRSFT